MKRRFTLPVLQAQLDLLEEGQLLGITDGDQKRLFGRDSAAAGRLANFAKGHGCSVKRGKYGMYFLKERAQTAAIHDEVRDPLEAEVGRD